MTDALAECNIWLGMLVECGIIASKAEQTNMFRVSVDPYGAWVEHPVQTIQHQEHVDMLPNDFVLWKMPWCADQQAITVSEVAVETVMLHGTSPESLVPIALARGILALAREESIAENHLGNDVPCAYFVPGKFSNGSLCREYAHLSRLFREGSHDSRTMTELLSAKHAATMRV